MALLPVGAKRGDSQRKKEGGPFAGRLSGFKKKEGLIKTRRQGREGEDSFRK